MNPKESQTSPLTKVLVVDDEPSSLKAVSRMLRGQYDVQTAPSGTLALEIVASAAKPDLILLDVKMPDMSGFDVLSRLKDNPLTRDIPVILVTALDSFDSQAQGLLAGAADFVIKPYASEIILARIATHLALKKATAELAARKDSIEEEVERRIRELMPANRQVVDTPSQPAGSDIGDLHHERTDHHILTTVLSQISTGEIVSPRFAQLVWHSDYGCGDTAVDNQHRALFDVANELIAAMLAERPAEEMEAMIDTLVCDVVHHFKDEEEAICATDFPFAVEHAAIHRELERMSGVLLDSFRAGTLTIGVLFQFLAHELISRHILGADRLFFPYIAMHAKETLVNN